MGRTKARRTLQAELSAYGMRNLANTISRYKQDVYRANERFVRRLAEEGFDIAQIHIAQATDTADRDKPIGTVDIITDQTGEVTSMRLQFTGEQVLFVEFGAGIKYNNENEPWANQFGYGVGTYPGQIHAYDKGGWSYKSDSGRWIHTYGTEATMPMYHASQTMKERIIEIAREVYQGVI